MYSIGLMSGTSKDGVDAVLIKACTQQVIATHFLPMPEDIKCDIGALSKPCFDELNKAANLNEKLGLLYAEAVAVLLKKTSISSQDISVIGNHGQTIRHCPERATPFSLQLSGAHRLAIETDIPVVSDFRQRDLCLGGQGAPLAPLYHKELFHQPEQALAVLNIGGISNLSYIDESGQMLGFDCGPGNCLMDDWVLLTQQKPYDSGGQWAESGQCITSLLDTLLRDPFYAIVGPKSLDRGRYELSKIDKLFRKDYSSCDIQATFLEFSVQSVVHAMRINHVESDELIVCGGGAHNTALMRRLQNLLNIKITDSSQKGFCPDFIEAMMFAWLASLTIKNQAIDLGLITGSRTQHIAGCIYPAREII